MLLCAMTKLTMWGFDSESDVVRPLRSPDLAQNDFFFLWNHLKSKLNSMWSGKRGVQTISNLRIVNCVTAIC